MKQSFSFFKTDRMIFLSVRAASPATESQYIGAGADVSVLDKGLRHRATSGLALSRAMPIHEFLFMVIVGLASLTQVRPTAF